MHGRPSLLSAWLSALLFALLSAKTHLFSDVRPKLDIKPNCRLSTKT
jgi:hypothetical protein